MKDGGDRFQEAIAYADLDSAHYNLKDCVTAIAYCELHLMVAKEAGITDNAAGYIYNYLGKAHQHMGDFKKAIVFHEPHLRASKELGYKVEEEIAYEDLGHAYFKIGNYDKAILFHELFLDVAK